MLRSSAFAVLTIPGQPAEPVSRVLPQESSHARAQEDSLSIHANRKVKQAEKVVVARCEATVARFLDFCEASPGRPARWESREHPWSFRVTLLHRLVGQSRPRSTARRN